MVAKKENKTVTKKEVKKTPSKKPEVVEEKSSIKQYHISKREDGRWQVKNVKAEKALKIFKTQKEAIDYAKGVAKNQEGSIRVHSKAGKLRKAK